MGRPPFAGRFSALGVDKIRSMVLGSRTPFAKHASKDCLRAIFRAHAFLGRRPARQLGQPCCRAGRLVASMLVAMPSSSRGADGTLDADSFAAQAAEEDSSGNQLETYVLLDYVLDGSSSRKSSMSRRGFYGFVCWCLNMFLSLY